MRKMVFTLACLLLLTGLQPVLAQGCGTIFWASQGNQEKYYNHGEEVVYRAGGGGIFRVYYRSRSRAPYTLITKIAHPWDFGLEGSKPAETRNIVRMQAQNQQQVKNGKINLHIGGPGVAWIGYEIVGAYRAGVFEKIPPRCRCQTAQIRVVPRGGGGGSSYQGLEQLLRNPREILRGWLEARPEIPGQGFLAGPLVRD